MSALSQSQLGIFYACQDLGEGNYQVPLLYAIPDDIDIDRFKAALEQVVQAHPYILSRISVGDSVSVSVGTDNENVVEVKEVDNIEDVKPTFCRAMDLLKDRLFRMEIYKTPNGNYFFMDFHHIIFDGSSMAALKTEITSAYDEGKVIGETLTGEDIANEELQLRQSDEWKLQQEWYMKEFGDAAEVDSMPVPNVSDSNGVGRGLVETNFQIPVKEATLKAICAKHEVKEGVVFMAAWGKLLANYSAEDKAYFTSIFSGRSDKRTRQAITMMVHTLPVFMQMPSEKSIADWLHAVGEQQQNTRHKNVYSYSDIHQDLNLRSDILFAYHGKVVSTDIFDFKLGGKVMKGQDLRIARPGITLDGQLLVTPNATETSDYNLRISYQSSLYSPAMIAGMADSYAAIINSMVVAERVGDLEAMGRKYQNDQNDQKCRNFQNDRNIMKPVIGLFEEMVEKYPDNECCVFEDKRYTYRQIGEITDRLAARIMESLELRDESLELRYEKPVVSFIVPRNELMLIVPVAIAKTGCTYQPLDSSYPKERLNFMIRDAEAQLLICTEEFRDLVDEYEGGELIINNEQLNANANANAKVKVNADDTFILLYTSGTTGTPKGVQLTQKNILVFERQHTKRLEIDSNSRLTAYASYGFDAYMMDLWAAMTTGAALHIISEEIRYDLVALKDYIEKEQITHAFMTTQVGTQMAVDFPDIPTLKSLMVGGEKLVSIDPPKYKLYNGYGPTECTVYVTIQEVTKNEKNIPIGSATENVQLYIVNKDGKQVPMGALGELWVAGTQVGKGYLNQPEKTAAVFIDNPFITGNTGISGLSGVTGNAGDYAKIYRTGDIVRYREDGLIEFIGRKDGQVKIRGFRIELKEVEAVIREFPAIKEVTVQAFDLDAGGKAIAAYIVADDKIDINELNAFIGAQKPPYMIPAITMQIDEIPVNVNGKVDKKKLPKPEMSAVSATGPMTTAMGGYAAPLNHLEEELMGIIAPLANTKEFGITTPLQFVGLTSITIIKLSAQLYKRFGINIPNKELREATLQSIENVIIDMNLSPREEGESLELRAESLELRGESFEIISSPLANAQLGVYYECMKAPMETTYNIPSVVRFPETVTPERLKEAVEKAIEAHPVLMAHFDNTTDPTTQVVEKEALPIVTISDKSVEELRKDFVQPFDLTNGPLYRATICGNMLLFDVHHLVMDGSSESVFLHDICNYLDGQEIEPESYTFFDYANEMMPSLSSEGLKTAVEDEKFFTEQLSTIDDATSLPADLHGNEGDGRPASVYQPVNHEKVEEYARQHGITPASVYLAAFEYLAARYSNTKDVCICTVSSGRSNVKISDTVGMFVNTLALVSHITDETVEDYIKKVAKNFADTLDHENYPFAKISDKFNLTADIAFVYELGVLDKFSVGGKEVSMENMELSSPKFKVTILIEEHEGKVCLVSEYNDALYSQEMMIRLLDSYKQVIENMLENSKASVTQVSIMSEAQRKEVSTMNCIGTAPLPIRLFHQGMERWAEKTPDHLAVIATDRTLTYKEFNEEANQIAYALVKRGVKKGDAVVVLLPRKSTTITTIFGIMKAGGAYIPCDPEYPTERIQLIAEDSGAPFVVTTKELVRNYGKRGLCVDELVNDECAMRTRTEPVDVQPTDLAYYIYTSGSTGKPKGVRVAHYNITTLFTPSPLHPIKPMMEDCERILNVATISFDASIFEYGMALFNGRTFVFANEEEAKDPVQLLDLIQRTKPDYFGCTSSRMLQYMEMPDFMAYMKNFKCILQGGEKFSEILLDKLRKINKKCVILNGYGPTEISIGCNSVDLQNAKYLSVGKPIPNYTEWIIDKDGNELPVGVTGELCVGGDGVTQGYNNLPEKTAEKFITYRGMRAFKTGDYARWLPNGEVEILGRTDNQVKLRGLRIELGEVENAIGQVEGVKNVLVKICNLDGRDHLSAYFVAEKEIDINEMKKSIGKTLTAYMVPTAYLQMEAFPITPNGKVDFRNLPQPLLAQSGGEYVAPANATEKFFADTFAQILNLEKVGATDSFFDLGGTSLVVMKVVINAQQAGYKLTYADVFANPTPKKLAEITRNSGISGDTGIFSQEQPDPDADIKDFEYRDIDRLLKVNNLEHFCEDNELRPLGDVLLTGATGFLGIHILKCLIEKYPDTTIHCLLRSKHGITAKERLKQLLFYYFEARFDDLFEKRIFVHEGDVTSTIAITDKIDTVINCAAIVKHFSKGTEIEDVNVGGVKNCIDFCLAHKARLIQVSTYSVAGASVNGVPDVKAYTEQMLYLGQTIHNQYIHSKIMGERQLLDAVATKGLDGKIMRVGNLSARSEDGEFQINVKTNSFMGRLKIYQMLGALPYSAYQSPVEFSPIDETSDAICLLAQTNRKCVVFHPYNTHQQMLGDILKEMKTIGKTVRLVEDEEFIEILNVAKLDPEKQEKLSAMLAYEGKESKDIVYMIPADNNYTIQVLLRLGFRWDSTSWDYIDRFLKQIDGLYFFDDNK